MSNELDKFLNRNIDVVTEYTRKIEDMLDQPHKYGYADDTLRGILNWIEERGDVSEAQMRAVDNINNKPSYRYGRARKSSRRW